MRTFVRDTVDAGHDQHASRLLFDDINGSPQHNQIVVTDIYWNDAGTETASRAMCSLPAPYSSGVA